MAVSLLVSILLLSMQLQHCLSQSHQEAIQGFSKQLDAISYLQEPQDIEEQVENIQETLQSLWTNDLSDLSQNASSLTEPCMASIKYILDDTSRLTPLIDATGKPGAGILGGNLILAAAFDECFNYNYTGYCLASSVFIRNLYKFPWKAGLCVPKYCTNADIAVIINSTEVLLVSENAILCSNTKSPSYSTGAIVMLAVSFLFVAMVLVGTLVDLIFKISSEVLCNEIQSRNSELRSPNSVNKAPTDETPLLRPKEIQRCKVGPLDFIQGFSLFKTVPMLLATKQGSSVITSLNGIRVISMFWVILGHVYDFLPFLANVDNSLRITGVLSRFSFQAVGNAFFSVDSFFFLSAVLVAYLTFREMKKKDGHFPFLTYYIHRVLRLTPTYMFVLFFAMFLTRYLAEGPFLALVDPFREACSKYWWTNLLYINNFYPWKLSEECLGWAWYLANDMQFYIIAPLMLITAYHFIPAGLIVAGVFLVLGFTIDAVLTGVFDFQASQLSVLAYNYTSKPGASQAYVDAIYTKPWDRISPYIVGLALGYILYKKIRFNYNKFLNLVFYGCLWIVATFVAFWLVYGLYFIWHGHIPHTAENIIYITFSRFLWACCLALVVYACHNGYGWFINSFLSMKLWTPLARMTFNAYLVHPIVIFVVFGQLETSVHYTDITMATFIVGCVLFSYATAAVICVTVEFPLGTAEMLIFKLFGAKGRESQRQDIPVDTRRDQTEVKA